MTRSHLLGAASAAALAMFSAAAFAAKPPITGGGATADQLDYEDEFGLFNGSSKATFSTFWATTSGVGQKAFITDDLTCDINAVTGGNGGQCSGPAGASGNTVSYAGSEATLSSTQISSWATSSFGQIAAGDLIQLPSMGTATALPVVNSGVTTNGGLKLTDNDLCGIFSGLITNFSQITDTGASLQGAMTVAYRADPAGTTFLLTQHLTAVCTSGNTAPGVTFTATTNFAALFPGGFPSNFVGETKINGMASYLAGCSSAGPVANAIGYLSPDLTTVDADSDATIACADGTTEKSPLLVPGVIVGTKSYLPSVDDIKLALLHISQGSNTTPPSGANETNPALWVPAVQKVSEGYSIVGYASFEFAQCYANSKISSSIIKYLKDHYGNTSYEAIINKNGFVSLRDTKASTFITAIKNDILSNKGGENANIGNPTVCRGLPGR
ncbi:MAG TPA: substrate-binding domain-containing protein [Acetobacteraceae bacterium]|nr:substrate-binding domain-containing protein [Acetobacteraceae bacterium]